MADSYNPKTQPYIKETCVFSNTTIRKKSIIHTFNEDNKIDVENKQVQLLSSKTLDELVYAAQTAEYERKKSKKTSIEINKSELSKKYYAFFCLGSKNPIRVLAILITESKLFEYFILSTILLTCVMMALDAPLPNRDKSKLNKVADVTEYFLLGIFTFEAAVKMVALGLVLHPGSYLRSVWNIIDFIVVVFGLISLYPAYDNLDITALRAVRVLRPLKFISGIPSLQIVMTSIVRTMFPLLRVLYLLLFVIVIYSIIGLEFFVNRFHFSCQYENKTFVNKAIACDESTKTGKFYFVKGWRCDANLNATCERYSTGLNFGISSFDNIFLAMITVFQCITLDGWTDIMYHTFQVVDENGYIFASYYISLIVIGAFLMLNLVLGVLSGEFAKEREKIENRREFIKQKAELEVNKACESYLEWIETGEDALIQEEGEAYVSKKSKSDRAEFNIIAEQAFVHHLSKASKIYFIKLKIKLLRMKLRVITKSKYFFWFVICMVFINAVIMGTEHYSQPQWLDDLQKISEPVFIAIFSLELLTKMFAFGAKIYFKSLFNCFDFVVVTLSILEYLIFNLIYHTSIGFSVFRTLRLLRFFKVTRYWSSLQNLVSALMNAMRAILSLLFLLFLFILVTALLGMQLFGGKFVKLETFPRTNFDSFQNSLLTVFQVITGEDWKSIMYDGIMAHGGPKNPSGVAISLYFIVIVIFGNYTLLNVFLAIAVDNLTNAQILTDSTEPEKLELDIKNIDNREQKISQLAPPGTVFANNELVVESPGTRSPAKLQYLPTPKKIRRWSQVLEKELLFDKNGIPIGFNELDEKNNKRRKSDVKEMDNGHVSFRDMNGHVEFDEKSDYGDDYVDIHDRITRFGLLNSLKFKVGQRRRMEADVPIVQKSSLFLFSPTNRFRKLCHQIVHFQYFNWFIIFVIFVSSITLALEDPVNEDAYINEVLQYFDYFFAAVFGIEVVLKVIDTGFVFHKGSYLRNSWNVLDIFIFLCNITSIIVSSPLIFKETDAEKAKFDLIDDYLRVLRVLRPLRVIHKVEKLQAVLQCMIYSLKNVAFVLIITWLILFIFACIGVELFKGKFYYCNDPIMLYKQDCQGWYYKFPDQSSVLNKRPDLVERKWSRHDFHFDNIFDAILTLYTSTTGERWPNHMFQTIDATDAEKGPTVNNKQYMSLYYIIFIVIFTFMIINIYIAFIILTFQRQGEKKIDGGLNRNQRDCIKYVLNVKPRLRYKPSNKKSFQFRVWLVVQSKPFEYFIILLIILNTIQLMMKYDGNSDNYRHMLMALNISFTAMFCVEAALKLVAYRINYFKDLWNIFDLLIIIGSMGDIILTEWPVDIIDSTMFRLFRAARIIKLLRKGKAIRLMLWTFLQSFKELPYVTALIMLLFYIYAVVGMQTFGKIKLEEGKTIFKYNNFTTIVWSLYVLLRCATGDSWGAIMLACYSDAVCVENKTNCGNTWISRIYFSSFIFLSTFLLLNLFVAVIMDNFEYLTRDSSILGPHHLDEFVQCWSQFDPGAKGRIDHDMLYEMLCRLEPPVGFGKKCPKMLACRYLIKMNMPIDKDGKVSFHTTLLALIRARLSVYDKGNMYRNNEELRRLIKMLWPKTKKEFIEILIPKYKNGDYDNLTIGKISCARLLVMNYRKRRKMKEDQRKETTNECMITDLPFFKKTDDERIYFETEL